MLASTFLDLVLGLDIHFELVPTPAPTPMPFPNPFVGVVFDATRIVDASPMALAATLLTGVPPAGPVLINGMPATNVGTIATNSLGVPHMVIPPGVAWAPMPKAPRPVLNGAPPPPPGSPAAPEGDAVAVLGSRTVNIRGASAVRMGDAWMSCGEPVRLPSSKVLALPKGPPVLIGGPPALSLGTAVGAALRTKWSAGPLHVLLSRLKPGRLRNLFSTTACFLTGHPVDVASGRVVTDHVDWELPGPLPLRFQRNYSSAWANRDGPLGHGWSHTLDQAVWGERGRVVYLDGEGREIEFDTFELPDHVIRAGQTLFEPINRLTLRAEGQGRYTVRRADGVVHEFAPVAGATGNRARWSRLVRIRRADGRCIQLRYDGRANLASVEDSAGRRIALEYDRAGRLTSAWLPHPVQRGSLIHTRYAYDAAGDLTCVTDPLGHCWHFAYKQHLLVQETDRNRLSFYFVYDGYGEDAYCVRTWGDGGIYDHVIDYDKAGKVTCVTNSLGDTTTYRMNVVGCVVGITDALGATVRHEYDDRTLWRTKTVDAVGGETRWEYDARGNCTRTIGPDSATTSVEYDAEDRATRVNDAAGGAWRVGYDDKGHVIGQVDPLDQRVEWRWDDGLMVATTDAAGRETGVAYDGHGNVVAVRTPDGSLRRWEYDRLGRVVAAIDAVGAVERRSYDGVGRVVGITEPDGNERTLQRDPEGNVTRTRDARRDVSFSYGGMGRLRSRTEAGATAAFEHDTEERLVAIRNEHGHRYELRRDAAGRVVGERDFGGLERRYERDAAGRMRKVVRPSGHQATYRYDEGGRVVEVRYGDGTGETYRYRADGALVEAANAAGTLVMERDLLGRVTGEGIGGEWVTSAHDVLGARVRVESSRGLVALTRRDAGGRPLSLSAMVGDAAAPWDMTLSRDGAGREVARAFPGGVNVRWDHDNAGRPTRRELSTSGRFDGASQWAWEVGGRLRMVVDALRGPTRYDHDARGALVAATYPDGVAELRSADAAGNLFRTAERGDRTFGGGGELLEARGRAGVTRYRYDGEGHLAARVDADGGAWAYEWTASGRLARVVRPDGEAVAFTYDALGRRLTKSFRGRTVRWLWDGDVPLHEWIDGEDNQDVTWLFEPDSFEPVGKLTPGEAHAIVTDHIGVPAAMYDRAGRAAWSATIDIYGGLRDQTGSRDACAFRWPGQYEDGETGLHYNRFRYYDPTWGAYISPDPAGFAGGLALYAYVADPLAWIDPLGLWPYYRGGRRGEVSFILDSKEATRTAPGTNMLLTVADPLARGLSLFDNEESVRRYGREPFAIVKESLSSTLAIAQRGRDPRHFEVLPTVPMTRAQYQQELTKLRAVADDGARGGCRR